LFPCLISGVRAQPSITKLGFAQTRNAVST
jgi:hypothetical protein